MAINTSQHHHQSGSSAPQDAIETPTSAIPAAATFLEDAARLTKNIYTHSLPSPPPKPTKTRMAKLRRQVRLDAQDEYSKRQMTIFAPKKQQGESKTPSNSSSSSIGSSLPRFTANEIYCGEKLGNGAFGTVYELLDIVLDPKNDMATTTTTTNTTSSSTTTTTNDGNNDYESTRHGTTHAAARSFMARHCLRDDHNNNTNKNEPKKDARYAIKKLRSKIVKGDKKTFQQALIDVATETRILASIPHHPNVIKLRGIAAVVSEDSFGPFKDFPSCCFHEDYFLVLDRLYGTLEDRLGYWSKEKASAVASSSSSSSSSFHKSSSSNNSNNGSIGGVVGSGNWLQIFQKKQQQPTKNDSFAERALACLDLASALAHLHKHNILHRDLKPPNVGFNIRGDLTVFDFGLSRELPTTTISKRSTNNGTASSKKNGNQQEEEEEEEDDDDDEASKILYRMTGFCGSPRYMAPEVGLCKLYNAKCDVYSFGLLAWQILTLQEPYKGCDVHDLQDIIWPSTMGPGDWKPHYHRPKRKVVKPKQQKWRSPKPSKVGNCSNTTVSSSFSFSKRPKTIARVALAKMIDRTFRRNIHSRPTMRELEDFLRNECRMMATTTTTTTTTKTMACDNTGESSRKNQKQILPASSFRRRSTYVFMPPPLPTSSPSPHAARRQSSSWSNQQPQSSVRGVAVLSSEQRTKEDSTHFGDTVVGFSESSSSDDNEDHHAQQQYKRILKSTQ